MQLNRVLKFFCRRHGWNTAIPSVDTGAGETFRPLYPFSSVRFGGTTHDNWFYIQRIAHIPRRAGHWRVVPAGLFLLVLFTVPTGCGQAVQRARTNEIKLPTVNVRLGEKTVKLWVSATTRTRDHGLMYIKKMPKNRGMLFVFHHPAPRTFWMKHTLIPLDLIFLNSRGVIVRHYTMEPDNGKKLYPSGHPIVFAIELNAGAFQHLKIHNTMRVHIPKLPANSVLLPGGNS